MQISRSIIIACVTTAILLPTVLRAEDTEAQTKARTATKSQQPAQPMAHSQTKNSARKSAPVFAPLPPPSSSADEQKAAEAMRQKMNELEQEALAAAARQKAAEENPVFQIVPTDVLESTIGTAAQRNSKNKKMMSQASAFPPIPAPPTGLSSAQEMQLQQLLQEYKADRISPDEYHTQRAKILAKP